MRNHWILGALAESYAKEEKENAVRGNKPKLPYAVWAETSGGDHATVDKADLASAKEQADRWATAGWFSKVWVTFDSDELDVQDIVYEASIGKDGRDEWQDGFWDSGRYDAECREKYAGFDRNEISSTYVERPDRWVVSLVVSYSGDIKTPEQAAYLALELTRDGASPGTNWYVHDRNTGETICLEQGSFEDGGHEEEEEA